MLRIGVDSDLSFLSAPPHLARAHRDPLIAFHPAWILLPCATVALNNTCGPSGRPGEGSETRRAGGAPRARRGRGGCRVLNNLTWFLFSFLSGLSFWLSRTERLLQQASGVHVSRGQEVG